MNAHKPYLILISNRIKAFFGLDVDLNGLSLKQASKIIPSCKRLNLSDTDKFRISQLKKAARELGYNITSNGVVTRYE